MKDAKTMEAAVAGLRAMREKIGTPERWTKKVSARNVEGHYVNVRNPDAVCWCVSGAHDAVDWPRPGVYAAAWEALLDAAGKRTNRLGAGSASVTNFNDLDTTRHEDVLALIDEAFEIASAGGAS